MSFGLNFAHMCCVHSVAAFVKLLVCAQHIAMFLFNYLSEGLLCLLCVWAHTLSAVSMSGLFTCVSHVCTGRL